MGNHPQQDLLIHGLKNISRPMDEEKYFFRVSIGLVEGGSPYLFTTYVASWLATVLLELGWVLTARLLINLGTLLPF